MRILINDYPGHPFQIQLSRYLAQHGHEVLHVYFQSIIAPRGSLQKRADDPPTLQIKGLSLNEPFQKYDFVKRLQQEIQYGKLLAEAVHSFKPEIVLSSNTPLDAQKILWDTCKKKDIPKIYWLQDLQGVAINYILEKIIPLVGGLIGSHYKRLENRLVKDSTAVVLITADFVTATSKWGVPTERTYIIPNWAPLKELPLAKKINDWSKTEQLDSSFVFLYSGTLGLKHSPELLLQLAQEFQDNPNVKVLVISEGLGADWLNKQKKALNIDNLVLKGYQPFSAMPDMLATADVHISILEPAASTYSVPSKVLTYLCAGRPLLLYVPANNLAAKIVSDCEAGYVTTEPSQFLLAAKKLFADSEKRQQMGNNARKYAEATFDIEKIGKKFEDLLEQCVGGESKCKNAH